METAHPVRRKLSLWQKIQPANAGSLGRDDPSLSYVYESAQLTRLLVWQHASATIGMELAYQEGM